MNIDRIKKPKQVNPNTAPPHEFVKYVDELETYVNKLEEQLRQSLVSRSLPSLDDATRVAVRISEEAIKSPLNIKEQAMFIAGFQECIKWLNVVFSNDR